MSTFRLDAKKEDRTARGSYKLKTLGHHVTPSLATADYQRITCDSCVMVTCFIPTNVVLNQNEFPLELDEIKGDRQSIILLRT